MSRHPFHVQDCESIWHLATTEDDDDDTHHLNFSRVSSGAFVATLPAYGKLPEGWTPSKTSEDTRETTSDNAYSTPIQETDTSGEGVSVTVQKLKGQYSLWVDGRVSSKDDWDVYRLPAYEAYYRKINVDGKKEQGMLTPVNFSVLIESGERPPERVLLNTYQVRRKSGAVLERLLIGETTIGTTNANDIIGKCVAMPYPCTYTQKPFVTIRDVGAVKLARAKKQRGFVYNMIAVGTGLVVRYSTQWFLGEGGDGVDFFEQLSGLGIPAGSTESATWTDWTLSLFTFGVPNLLLLGFTASTFVDWYVGIGLVSSVFSLTSFLTTAFKSVKGNTIESSPLSDVIGLFGDDGFAQIAEMGWRRVLPTALLWMGKNFLKSRPQPEVRRVRFTPMDIVESLRTLASTDTSVVSKLDYKERVLVEWMLEPSLESEGYARKYMRSAANYIGKAVMPGPDLFTRSGDCILDGFEPMKLVEDTLDIEYEIVVVDSSLCGPTPVKMIIRGDNASMLNGGFLSSGIVEDNETLRSVVLETIDIFSSREHTWKLLNAVMGVPFRQIPQSVVNAAASKYNDSVIKALREKMLTGLSRIEHEIRELALQPLVDEALSRNRMRTFSHRHEDRVCVFRLLPQRLETASIKIATPQKSDLSNIRYDTTSGNDTSNESTTSGSSTPSIAEKENKFVADAAKRAHLAAYECLKDFAILWKMGTRRPAIWQLYKNTGVGADESQTQAAAFLTFVNGTRLGERIQYIDSSRLPFSYNYPLDISLQSTVFDTLLSPTQVDVTSMADRRDAMQSNSDSCAWNAAVLSLSEIVCDVHVLRSMQTGSMGVMLGVAALTASRIRSGLRLLETLFPSSDAGRCWFLHDNDPVFYAIPGGRLLRCVVTHLVDMDSTFMAFTNRASGIFVDTEPLPLSGNCREFASAFRYTKSTPELVSAYGAPDTLFSLLRRAIASIKKVEPHLFKMPLASPVSSAVTDIAIGSKLQSALSRISGSLKALYTFGNAALPNNTALIHIALSKAVSDPLIDRLSFAELIEANRVADELEDERANGLLDVDVDIEKIDATMRLRNMKHTLEIESFYDGSEDVAIINSLADTFENILLSGGNERKRFLFPFACGSWTVPMELHREFNLNFDTVPVSTKILSYAVGSVLDGTGKTQHGTVCDRFGGYNYEEWDTSSRMQSPFVVEVEASSSTSWISMSNSYTLYEENIEPDFGDADPSVSIYAASQNAKAFTMGSIKREGSNTLLWNAERIVQAVYCLVGFTGAEKQKIVFVRPPRGWKPSDTERELRAREERRVEDELEAHDRMQPFAIRAYMNAMWDAVLRVKRGLVNQVNDDRATQDAAVGAAAAAAVPAARPQNTGTLFAPAIFAYQPPPGNYTAGPDPVAVVPNITTVQEPDRYQGPLFAVAGGVWNTEIELNIFPQSQVPEVAVAEQSSAPLENIEDGVDKIDYDTEEDADETETGANEESKTSEDVEPDPERVNELRPDGFSSVDILPTIQMILTALSALKLGQKGISYVQQSHKRYVKIVDRWKKKKADLEAELQQTRNDNQDWEDNVDLEVRRVNSIMLSHACCSVAIAQTLIHQVAGDFVRLYVHPESLDIAETGGADGRQYALTKRDTLVSGLDACTNANLNWVTLGEVVYMFDAVCSN